MSSSSLLEDKKWRNNRKSTKTTDKNDSISSSSDIIIVQAVNDIKMIPSPSIKKGSSPLLKKTKKKNISSNKKKANTNWSITDYFTPTAVTADTEIDINDTNDDLLLNRKELQTIKEVGSSSSFITPVKKIKTEHVNGDKNKNSHVITPCPKVTTLPSKTSELSKSKDAKSTSLKRKSCKQQQNNQLYLDFGQSSFGRRRTCNICNMVYVEGLSDDESNHSKLCKEYSLGVSYTGYWKRERVVYTNHDNGDRIIEIRPSDPQIFHNKASAVKKIIDKEMGFIDDNDQEKKTKPKYTTYLYISSSKKRIIGYCSAEIISKAYKCNSNGKNGLERSSKPIKPTNQSVMLGIRQIWCHSSHRKNNIATALVNCIREKFVFGCYVPLENIAFSSPTTDGYAFFRKYTGSDTPLVYDLSSL